MPTLQVLDVYLGADQPGNREYLLDHDVRLRGFVTRVPDSPAGDFVLNRFLISCCAADAARLSVGMTGAVAAPPDDTWIEVRARLVTRRSTGADGPSATFQVRRLRRIATSSEPYEGLR